ncbi:MAG: helix-turn-helix transcriptional regulator [Bacteroidota bacterium]
MVTKPLPNGYPEELQTVGDHLRAIRLDRNLRQHQVAEIIGVSGCTINFWENNIHTPRAQYWGNIIAFLGYDPAYIEGNSLAVVLQNYRRQHGLSVQALGGQLGVAGSTICDWEQGKKVKYARSQQLKTFCASIGRNNVAIPYYNFQDDVSFSEKAQSHES